MTELIEPDAVVRARAAYEKARDLAGHLLPAIEDWQSVHNLVAELLKQRDELVVALADCVTKATEYGEQDGGFVAFYILPTGPIHRAIPLLERHGVIVRPGFDGREATHLREKVVVRALLRQPLHAEGA